MPTPGLHYDTPATVWDEALPIGNGTLGSLVWGDGHPLRFSLDRADLWDLRPVEEFQGEEYTFAQLAKWRGEGNVAAISKLYDDPYANKPAPTKLPAGRIELSWPEDRAFQAAALDIESAVASVQLDAGKLEAFIHATDPIGIMRGTGELPKITLVAPAFSGAGSNGVVEGAEGGDYGDLTTLQYPAPVESSGENWRAFNQQGYEAFQFAVYIAWRCESDTWQAAYSIATTNEGEDPLEIARLRVEAALVEGFDAVFESHKNWWDSYWSQSSLQVPDELLQTGWYLEQYKFGAAARRGAPPIPLQGPWTADDGKLPPWKGDLHHDLNTQLSYWPCYGANHLEEGLSYLDWLWEVRPTCLEWTKNYYGVEGLNISGVTDLNSNALGGWAQYSFSCTTSAWLAQHFYWHWRYSFDQEFLRERAYPYLNDVAVFIEAMTSKLDADGYRTLELSSSPEIHDNRLTAWFSSITNYDLSLIRWLLGAVAELAGEIGEPTQAQYWRGVLAQFPDLPTAPNGTLLVAKGVELHESHRHFSHLMALYPLKLVHPDQGPEAVKIYEASLAQLEELGTSLWTGYSFSWLAAILAQTGDGEKAAATLRTFYNAFTLRNSFHCNGDQSGQGFSNFTYRPFTLEGNFAAALALQEMLLQSHDGILRFFPAIPDDWSEVSFNTLRAEGAYLVSAKRENGRTSWVKIEAEHDGTCRMISPFSGELVSIEMKVGEGVELVGE